MLILLKNVGFKYNRWVFLGGLPISVFTLVATLPFSGAGEYKMIFEYKMMDFCI